MFVHPHAPGVTVAGSVSTNVTQTLSKTSLLTSANEIAHEECGLPLVMQWCVTGI